MHAIFSEKQYMKNIETHGVVTITEYLKSQSGYFCYDFNLTKESGSLND